MRTKNEEFKILLAKYYRRQDMVSYRAALKKCRANARRGLSVTKFKCTFAQGILDLFEKDGLKVTEGRHEDGEWFSKVCIVF